LSPQQLKPQQCPIGGTRIAHSFRGESPCVKMASSMTRANFTLSVRGGLPSSGGACAGKELMSPYSGSSG
jgi:hypothetical protein